MSSSPTVRRVGDVPVVEVGGDLDVQTGPALREALYRLAAEQEREVVLDLSGVGFLDSSGLGVLVGALKRLRAHDGTLRLAGCQQAVTDVLSLTGLNRVFFLHADVEAALQAASGDVIELRDGRAAAAPSAS